MTSLDMIVLRVLVDDVPQMSFTKNYHPIEALGFYREYESLGVRIQIQTSRWQTHRPDSGLLKKFQEALCVQRISIVNQESLSPKETVEPLDKVTSDLMHPETIRRRSNAGDLHSPSWQVDHEEHHVAHESDARSDLHREEVSCHQRFPVHSQKLLPWHVLGSLRRRFDPLLLEDAADRRPRHTVAQMLQHSLDPCISPSLFSRASRVVSFLIHTMT